MLLESIRFTQSALLPALIVQATFEEYVPVPYLFRHSSWLKWLCHACSDIVEVMGGFEHVASLPLEPIPNPTARAESSDQVGRLSPGDLQVAALADSAYPNWHQQSLHNNVSIGLSHSPRIAALE